MRNDLKLTPWTISHRGPGWADDFCESIFFLGNGRMGVRGYLSSEPAPRPVQKGLYLAGIFGEIKPGITDFVNLLTPVREAILIDGAEPSLAGDVERVAQPPGSNADHPVHPPPPTESAWKSSTSDFFPRTIPPCSCSG